MQIVIDGRLLNFIEINPKGKTDLIILHGWAHTGALWQNLAGKLDKNIHCYLMDLPAFGSSQALPGNPSVPEYTETIVKFVKKLDLEKPVILGHSFGGQIALDLATKNPKLIGKIILISPAGIRRKTLKAALIKKSAKIVKQILPIRLIRQTRPITKFFYSGDYINANPDQKIVLSNIVKYDLSAKLSSIKVPTHIIWGSEDREIPYMGKLMNEQIPDSRLSVLYGAGHSPHLSHTDKLAQIINQTILHA